MNLAYAYQYIYLLIVTLLTIPIVKKYSMCSVKDDNTKETPVLGTFLVFVAVTFFIGCRPQSGAFVDMRNYIEHYYALYYGMPFHFSWDEENFLFDNYFHLLGSLNTDISIFFFSIAVVYFGASYWGICRLFPKHTYAAYLFFLAAFSTFSYGTNGIKAGAAASMFILALSYWDRWKICIPLMFVSLGLHHSMKMPIAAFAIAYFIKNPKFFFYVWFICFLIALVRITFFQDLFSGIAEDANGYLDISSVEGGNRKTGFRIDLIIYSVVPILVGFYAIMKKRLVISRIYQILLCTYITANAVWMLCIYASFTNRIAYLSWLMYPVVLAYPLLYENWGVRKYQTFAKVMLAHLGFTLFMQIIYYA